MNHRKIAALAVLTITGAGCGLLPGGDKHAVGECARLEPALGGMDLDAADCGDTTTMADPIYRVDSVLALGEPCPALRGFMPVQLDHEPDDVTYCLVLDG